MAKRFDILCQGSLCTELLAGVGRYPQAGDAIMADSIQWTSGGMAANTAAAVARLGGRVAFLSASGDDHFGCQAREELHKTGVNVDFMVQRQNKPSPIVILMVNPSLQRAGLVLNMDSQYQLKGEDVPDEIIQSSKIFYTDLHPVETSIALAVRAKGFGLKVAFDMQMTETHLNSPGYNQRIDDLFELTDYFFADEENFLDWTGAENAIEGCNSLLARHSEKTLLITRGKQGSLIANSSGIIEIPAFLVPVIDTIGAGDAYHGAFMVAHLVFGLDLRDAGLFASATSAISCMNAGARDGLPDRRSVLDFLRERHVSINLKN